MRTGIPSPLPPFMHRMKAWPLACLALLAGPPAGFAADLATLERQGKEALAGQLWEIAELHFKECLRDDSADEAARSRIAILLAESLIRNGNPGEALELLDRSFVTKNPEAPFWKSQALAGQGRFAEAAAGLENYLADPASLHRPEAGLTRASLLLALGRSGEALDTLAGLRPAADAATEGRIRLYQVEILLDLGRTVEARATLPAVAGLPERLRPTGDLLDARILLDEGHPADAQERFQELLLRPQGLSLSNYHSAAIFSADSLHALGSSDAALRELTSFIDTHRASPLLDAMFRRILQWMPDKPDASDWLLDRLATWVTPPALPAPLPFYSATPTRGGAPTTAWPDPAEPDAASDLSLLAAFTRAVALQRMGTPESHELAGRLFNRIRVENPRHIIAARSLYQQARLLLDAGSVERALDLLDALRENPEHPLLQGRAAFLEARTAYLDGNPQRAITLFDEAAKSLTGENSRLAAFQAALTRLRLGDNGVSLIQQVGPPADSSLESDLLLERALAAPTAPDRQTRIEEFLARFPNHARAAEARLVAAEAALGGTEPDVSYAKAQLDTLAAMPAPQVPLPPQRIAMARLRILDLSDDPSCTTLAKEIAEQYPGTSQAAEASFTLGRRLFQGGNYNPARLVLEKLAADDPDSPLSQAAWLVAARAAALGGTPQSKEQALVLFDKAIQATGELRPIAALEKARHLIDMYRYPEAAAFLSLWLGKLPPADPLQLPGGLLLGEALEGGATPDSLARALAVYDRLLGQTAKHPALLNRLQYLRGRTLEQLPDPKDAAKTRENEAFEAYHSVLEADPPPAEWEYFERCGFKALALLEKAERWQAAITIAKKIASYQGPRAAEASARAVQLQLDHMIWED